jgi:putative flippase GtrA
VFVLLNWGLKGLGSFSYMYAALLASIIAITVAFLGNKWFVFKTHGNYLIEWIRGFGVYGTGMLIGLTGLPILVTLLRPRLRSPELASSIAAAIMTLLR